MKKENLEQMAAIGHIIQGWSTTKYTNYYFYWEFSEGDRRRQMCFSCTNRTKLEKLHEFLKGQVAWGEIPRRIRLQIISAFFYSDKII